MNPNWLKVEMKYDEVYPQEIMKIAKKCGVSPKDIAEQEGVQPGVVGPMWLRRDQVEMIYRLQQDPWHPDDVIVEFINGLTLCLYDPKQNLWRKIDRFLQLEPTIEFNSGGDEEAMDPEEIAEMGANYEKTEDDE